MKLCFSQVQKLINQNKKWALFIFLTDIQFGLHLLNVSFAFNDEKQNEKEPTPLKKNLSNIKQTLANGLLSSKPSNIWVVYFP